jgi:ParB/RepB/Spo0J family partition protein
MKTEYTESRPEPVESAGQIVWLSLKKIASSPLNPRTHFDGTQIEELAESFREHGFTPSVSHLLVRPIFYRWRHAEITNGMNFDVCTDGKKWVPYGRKYRPEDRVCTPENGFLGGSPLTTADCKRVVELAPAYELVCGERRWRAAGICNLESVPVVVKVMSDTEVLELQLVENLQRADLTELEEAKGFQALLDLRDGKGEPVYSRKSLAQKVGRSVDFIADRLAICPLAGSPAGTALEAGKIGFRHALLLTRVPSGKQRNEMTKRVVKGVDGQAPMPTRVLERLIREECTVELRGAAFDLGDESLVPMERDVVTGERLHGGACNDCPFNTANMEQAGSRLHMCTNPECFGMKKRAGFDVWKASVQAEGVSVLDPDAADRIFDVTGKKLSFNCGFVSMDAMPPEHDLRKGVDAPGTWRKLLRGLGVPLVLAKDADGKVHEIVDHKQALAAARVAEHARPLAERVFKQEMKEVEEKPADKEEYLRQQESKQESLLKAQRERQRARRIEEAQRAAVVQSAKRMNLPDGFWLLAIGSLVVAVDALGDPTEIADRHGAGAGDPAARMIKAAAKMTLPEQISFAVELMIAICGEADRELMVAKWAKALGVDLKGVRKDVETAIAAEDAAAAAAAAVANGIAWVTKKEAAEDFEWFDSGVAMNPDVAEVAFPKDSKVEASISVAKTARGWVFGFTVKGAKWGSSSPCKMTETKYSSREVAKRSGLIAIEAALKEKEASPSALKRIGEYLAHGAGPEKVKAARRGK